MYLVTLCNSSDSPGIGQSCGAIYTKLICLVVIETHSYCQELGEGGRGVYIVLCICGTCSAGLWALIEARDQRWTVLYHLRRGWFG